MPKGVRLADQWRRYFADVEGVLRKELSGVLDKIEAAIKPLKGNEECYAGRETAFNLGVARQYVAAARSQIGRLGEPEDLYKKRIVKALTYVQAAADFAGQAQTWAAKPQDAVILAEYAVKTSPTLSAGAERSIPQTQICLNGIWNYSVEGGPEKPPAKWDETFIPNGSWQWAVNKLHASDDEWAKADANVLVVGKRRLVQDAHLCSRRNGPDRRSPSHLPT